MAAQVKYTHDRRTSVLNGTNLYFSRWNAKALPPKSASTERIPRFVSSRSSSKRHRIFTHKQPKVVRIVNDIHNVLENNPQVRPSICTFISGIFLLLSGLAVILVPLLYHRVPTCIGILGIIIGAILIFGGLIGIAIRYPSSPYYIKSKRKKHGNSTQTSEKDAKKDNLKSAWKTSIQYKCKDQNCNKAETTCTTQMNSNHKQKMTLLNKFTRAFSIQRRGSNEDKEKVLAHHLCQADKISREANNNNNSSREIRALDQLSLDVAQNGKDWDDNRRRYRQIGFQDEKDYHRKLLRANELFDIYHDPLLQRATTRLKFKCDCEFYQHGVV